MNAPRLAALIWVLPCLAWSQAPRRTQPPRRTLNLLDPRCLAEVSTDCADRCVNQNAAAPCAWSQFGCDFKLCWAEGESVHNARMDLVNAVAEPAAYAMPAGIPAPAGGINAFAVARFTSRGDGEVYLRRGQFEVNIFGLDSPDRGRAVVQRAQACATLARRTQAAFIARNASSGDEYYVVCGGSGVAFRQLAPPPPPSGASAAAGASGGGAAAGGAPAPAAGPSADPYARISAMSSRDLEDMLRRTQIVTVNGNQIRISGVNPFSPGVDPQDREDAMNELQEDERLAVKELYSRNVNQTLTNAQSANPAPDGQTYVYNDDTGQAELQQVPANPKGNASASPKRSAR